MTTPVKLYVYDLSNGMARQLSRQLTGRQIDGIWHTSVVVFGKEIFYGHGIDKTLPGRSHHGTPHQVIDMGTTALDEETFNEYLIDMEEHYTADKYHLLDFNCNSFTNDCIGFLTGGSIPSYIKDLPTDFLSTPFGAALRPTIDGMYRRPSASTPTPIVPSPETLPNPQLASSILQSVASQAQAQQNGSVSTATPLQATNSLTAPMHVITNSPAYQSFLKNHRAAVAFFTSATCGPCKMIEPVFEVLSEEKGVREGRNGAGFAKIDIDVGLSQRLAAELGIRATPTFFFYLDGKKIDELKGASAGELRTQVDLLLFQAYPPHPHTSLSLPAIQALSLNPILFSQVPSIDTVVTKLSSFIDTASWPPTALQSQAQVKEVISGTFAPYLQHRFTAAATVNGDNNKARSFPATPALLKTWTQTTSTLTLALPIECLFPIVDMWRLAFLDPAVGGFFATYQGGDPISIFLPKANSVLQQQTAVSKSSRNYILTILRLLANTFSSPSFGGRLVGSGGTIRSGLTAVIVGCLLYEDAAVRSAAAGLVFNVAGWVQKKRVDAVKSGGVGIGEGRGAEEEEEWEVEMVSAVMEAIDREKESEEVVHRLTATLAFLLRLSPTFSTQLRPLLQVLQCKQVLDRKVGLVSVGGGDKEKEKKKKEVRRLIEEVAQKLCS